ncbi:50S ribosomal protein L27-like [Gossypium australe]|uniref:50S ribosomal protein L27-like n=1 Tax=Gossypium australe TaxID=47621 RepID=A0A5B6VCT5_9ROSI|nr:50S ribosomal protein L27-like [Gossypium australe]
MARKPRMVVSLSHIRMMFKRFTQWAWFKTSISNLRKKTQEAEIVCCPFATTSPPLLCHPTGT